MADPRTEFDRWFRDRIEATFGFDPASAAPRNEPLGEWREG